MRVVVACAIHPASDCPHPCMVGRPGPAVKIHTHEFEDVARPPAPSVYGSIEVHRLGRAPNVTFPSGEWFSYTVYP